MVTNFGYSVDYRVRALWSMNFYGFKGPPPDTSAKVILMTFADVSLLFTEVSRGSNNAYATPIATQTACCPCHADSVLSLNLLKVMADQASGQGPLKGNS